MKTIDGTANLTGGAVLCNVLFEQADSETRSPAQGRA